MSIISLSAIFLVILVIVFIGIGVYYQKRASTSEGFLLAGRSAPFWLMASAYLGGAIGGASVSGFTGYGFTSGISGIWPAIFPTIGCTLFIIIFARRLNYFGRSEGAVTISDFICKRYGESVRLPAAIISFFRPAFLTGMQFIAIAVVLKIAFEWPMWLGVIVSAVVILLYLITAGQYSALVTQWIQSILQSLSIILFAFITIKLAGGQSTAVNAFYNVLPQQFVNGLQVDLSQFSVWFLTMGLFYLVDPWVYMWAYVGESPRVSQNAQLATMGANFFSILVFLSGMCVAVAVTAGNLILPEGLTPDGIYSYIALNNSGITIGTFLIVGLLMTIISCGSSFAMNGVTILTRDIYQFAIKHKNVTDKQMVKASRVSVVIVVLAGIVGALWLPILVPLWILAQAIAISGLLAAVLSAWFWKRSTTPGAMASIVLGGGSAIVYAGYAWVTTGSPGSIIHGIHACHIGLAVSIVAMVLVSLLTKPEYEKAAFTSYKTLGDNLKQNEIANGTVAEPGFFGMLEAKTPLSKLGWITVVILFVLHIVLVVTFMNMTIGFITLYIALVSCIAMLIIFGILGAVDLKKFNKA